MATNEVRAKIVEIACKQVETCLEYRQNRFAQIAKYEDMYAGKTKPAAKGRFNIPVPIMEGFVQTLESKIDDSIRVKFKKTREATLKISKKFNSAWERDSAPDRGDYNGADLDAKKLAMFSGFGTLKLVPASKPYSQTLTAVDYHDLIFEPYGGRDMEKHLFKGQLNIFKTAHELKNGDYDQTEVGKILTGTGEKDLKKVKDDMDAKTNRFLAMGLNPKNYNYVGVDTLNLTEMVTRYNGEDYYVLFHYPSQIAVKCVPLKEMFSNGLSPWVTWHAERSPVNFLGRAPVDPIYPVAEAMRILINQNFDNIQKRNWGQIAYNARKIVDPREFKFSPSGLVRVKLADGESMDNAYRQVETPDTSSITINLVQFLNSFLGEKTGVTPGTQGNSEEDKVGIYYGNIQQAADRFGLINKFYVQSHIDIAKRYKSNLIDYGPNDGFMVRYLGVTGLKEEPLTKKEMREDLGVEVISANLEAENDQVTMQQQAQALQDIISNQVLLAQINPKVLVEERLRLGKFSEDKVKSLADSEGGANAELLSEAAQAIEMIEDGEKPKANQGANTAFIRKIIRHAQDESDRLTDKVYAELLRYANSHMDIARRNLKLLADASMQPQQPQGQPSPQLTPAIQNV